MATKDLHPLAKARCSELQKATGHQLAIEDWKYLARLDSLARAVASGSDTSSDSVFNRPVPCGNATLRRPSLNKVFWYNECACDWYSESATMLDMAYLFILATDNSEEWMRSVTNKDDADHELKLFAGRLTCTDVEVELAVARVWPERESGDGSDDGCGALIAMLVREYGNTPNYWLCEADLGIVEAMIHDYTVRMDAEVNASKKASRAGGGVASGPPTVTAKMKAMHKLRQYSNALQKRWADAS